MGCQSFKNLKLFRKLYKLKTVNILRYMIPQIAAGPSCPTRRLSNLIDILLKPFLIHIKSYIKDNLDFLAKCSRENKWDTILTTFDVVGLYSNIPHEYGLEAIEYWLDKFSESLHPKFSKEFVLESVKLILENNNLNFNNEYFNQIKGTAMDTMFAPAYANLTMRFFELTFYDLCKEKIGEDLSLKTGALFSMTVKPCQRKTKSTLMIYLVF